uniref:Fe-Mn family superoxide dismutase n=1 Tax=uncultured Halomonas sp. TaxID=173971 RepID=UPI00262403FD|nr:Fe-Mn family superoxide dismutase [uncultured Halomonas sp.]
MPFELPALPYDTKALEPHLSRETVIRLHGQTQRACLTRLNRRVAGTPWAAASLEAILLGGEADIARQAAKAWALTFYWHSLSPQGGSPDAALIQAIEARWGSLAGLEQAFATAAGEAPDDGWIWLVRGPEGLAVLGSEAHQMPLTLGLTPLLVHHPAADPSAPTPLSSFWKLANWWFAAINFAGPTVPG